MTMKERMTQGKLYRVNDALMEDLMRARRLLRLFNSTSEEQGEYRAQLLRELFGSIGEDVYIEPTFRCDYGCNITVGNRFFANYDCIILDVCPVTIGNNVMLGPRVGIYTPLHPLDAVVRSTLVEYGKPIEIGDDVWIGGNAVVNGGVKIGSGTVIGSGSVVTRSIPSGVLAAGNPCRVLREITEEDAVYWKQQKVEFDQYINSLDMEHTMD